MYRRPFWRRRVRPPREEKSGHKALIPLAFLLLAALCFLISALIYLKTISCQIAVSDASDIMILQVNKAISQVLQEGSYQAEDFVELEKNNSGEVTAVRSNMAQINALSTILLEKVVGLTENRTLTVSIPMGNLTGISLLMGRGPGIPVEIMVLTSSHVEFCNNILTAGINQTKHQISLLVIVDIDVLVPWGTESTQVSTEVLISDTVLLGQVPQTFLQYEGNEG